MNGLANKQIIVGITGSIAAYKGAELVRRLREAGADVRVVMTRGACEFITPLTLQALSGHPVHVDLLDARTESAMGHIELARWADAVMIAPAGADFLARLAHGRADDLLATLCLAAEAPLLVAPAMNRQMWLNPATQDNAALLRARGIRFAGPDEGVQACGETGPGRMPEPGALALVLGGIFLTGSLEGSRVLVSAGPTREAIDPVRFIGNRSSGRMGYAVAEAAAEAGAEVTLVSGPVGLDAPGHVTRFDVTDAGEMHAEIMAQARSADIFFSVAAVADYRPAAAAPSKLKRDGAPLTLTLEPTPDILRAVADLEDRPFIVGFAAETDDLEANAQRKLHDKGIDIIAANRVGYGDTGFDSEENALSVFWRGGQKQLQRSRKTLLARHLVDLVATHYHETHTTEDH